MDTFSAAQTTGEVYCGARTYTITATSSDAVPLSSAELYIDSATRMIKVYTADKNKIGTHDVVITVALTSYLSIPVTTFPPFKVTIDHCIVTSFTMQDLSPVYNRTYTLAD